MSLRPRCMTPWRCLWTVVLMAIHGASVPRLDANWDTEANHVCQVAPMERQSRGSSGNQQSTLCVLKINCFHMCTSGQDIAVLKDGTMMISLSNMVTPLSAQTTFGFLYFKSRAAGKPVAAAPAQRLRTHSAVIAHRGVARRDRRNARVRGLRRWLEAQRGSRRRSPRGAESTAEVAAELSITTTCTFSWTRRMGQGTAGTRDERQPQRKAVAAAPAQRRRTDSAVIAHRGKRYNDLHLYVDEAAGAGQGRDQEKRWQQLRPSGTAPPPRYGHSAVWRAGTGGMLVFGGAAVAGSSAWLTETELSAASPPLRSAERPSPVPGPGGWGVTWAECLKITE
eukprot:Skav227702  [mRNA]  locus=scaffold2888:43001:48097:+ [translate_table: standard]